LLLNARDLSLILLSAFVLPTISPHPHPSTIAHFRLVRNHHPYICVVLQIESQRKSKAAALKAQQAHERAQPSIAAAKQKAPKVARPLATLNAPVKKYDSQCKRCFLCCLSFSLSLL
jgi:hypothetical protein